MHRREVFGNNRAFLPMNLSGQGALTEDDVKTLQTGYLLNCPDDENKSSVLYYDRSKRPQDDKASARILFFALQSTMANEASQKDGFVLLMNLSNVFSSDINISKVQFASRLIQEAMPIRVKRIHLVCRPPGGRHQQSSTRETSKCIDLQSSIFFWKRSLCFITDISALFLL
jgi:Divergent CRAL/TRIO domain